MSDRYVCWEPASEGDPGVSPSPGQIVENAYDVEDAAAEYAEREWGNTDPYETTTVNVRDSNGMVHAVEVTVEYEPTFSGRLKP